MSLESPREVFAFLRDVLKEKSSFWIDRVLTKKTKPVTCFVDYCFPKVKVELGATWNSVVSNGASITLRLLDNVLWKSNIGTTYEKVVRAWSDLERERAVLNWALARS